MRKLQIGACAAVMGSAVLAGAPNATRADTVLPINEGNPAISGFTGPYATVDIHLVSSTSATVTFTSLTNSGNIYLMGGGGAVGLNVNAASWNVITAVGTNSGTGFTPVLLTNGGAGNEDGFGSFNETFNSADDFTGSKDTVFAALINTSGTWASSDNVLTPNASGFEVAAQIFVTSSPADAANGALATGFATNSAVPEPSTWAMMLLGFAALGFAFYRSRGKLSFA